MGLAAEFHTRRGRIRSFAVAFISILAVVSLVISGLPVAATILLSLTIVLMAYRSLADAGTHAIRLDQTASPSLDGTRGVLTAEAVTGWFIALKLIAPDGQIRRIFLFRDELGSDDFRALLAYLRHG